MADPAAVEDVVGPAEEKAAFSAQMDAMRAILDRDKVLIERFRAATAAYSDRDPGPTHHDPSCDIISVMVDL